MSVYGKSIDLKKREVDLGNTKDSLVKASKEIPRKDRLAEPRR